MRRATLLAFLTFVAGALPGPIRCCDSRRVTIAARPR